MSSINQINPGRRPSIAEIRDYYSRDETLNELLQAMQHWHVRFVPGYAKSRWVYTENRQELHSMIMKRLGLMEKHPERKDYPYFRINWERHRPAYSWDEKTLWGYDFVIEKDSFLWQECFEAMFPVMDILEHLGVHYWLKYTGHHSLHLIIPAEVFPQTFRGIPLKDKHKAIYHRLMVFLNKRANQKYNDHDRHCPPGTNMPYSMNEDTGLINYPLLREELEDFRPWHASIHLAKVRDFWRTVPKDAYGKADALLKELMKPYDEQIKIYPPISHQSIKSIEPERWESVLVGVRKPSSETSLSVKQAIEMLKSDDALIRRFAAWVLMLMADNSSLSALCQALADEDADVRWFAANDLLVVQCLRNQHKEAMFRFGNLDAMPKLLEMQPDDMANGSFVDFCVKHGESTIPFLVEALKKKFTSTWSSLPIDKALERIGDACKPILEKMLEDGDAENREKASNILSRLSGTPSIEQILEMSHSKQHKQRKLAARMLAWYDEPRTIERLLEMVNDKNQVVRKEAVKALGCIDHPESEEILQHALLEPNAKVHRWAERGLEMVIEMDSLMES